MGKIQKLESNGEISYWFYCPGCNVGHIYDSKWTFNGNFKEPSFSPSLFVNKGRPDQCHLFITDGKIKFIEDSHHHLKGKTVDMIDAVFGKPHI